MFQYHCLNPIAQKGLDIFDDNYKKADTLDDCQAGENPPRNASFFAETGIFQPQFAVGYRLL